MLIKQTTEMTERERIAVENSNNQYLQALAHVAVGTIYPFAGQEEPDTFMFCDGRELDIVEYSKLFSVIGYTYGGSGDFFNLPDLRGKTLVGRNENDNDFFAVGKIGGEKEHTLTIDEMPSHTHGLRLEWEQNEGGGIVDTWSDTSNARVDMDGTQTKSTGGNQPHNNMPPYMIVNYIIKVSQKAPDNYYSKLIEEMMVQMEDAVEQTEENAQKTEQAYSDFLNQLGTDVATLVGGKIPMNQIPATATQEIYTVTSEDELTSLTAQRGDLAELIEEIDGERTITKTWQCLGDSSKRDNWVVWGTSYAVSAGNATTATNAENANTINNHRIIEISAEDFEMAVKDENTYYLVY